MNPVFKWHSIVHVMCKELNLTPKKVYKNNYIDTLNWLSFYKEKQRVEKVNSKN